MSERKTLFIGIVVSIAALLFLLIGINQNRPLLIDESISAVFSLVPESLNPIFRAVTELGDKLGIGIVGLLMLGWLLVKKRDFLGMGILALSVALGNEANKLLKNLIGRERPALEHMVDVNSLSFPSGHAMVGSILYLSIAYFLMKEYDSPSARRWIALGAGSIIFLIGASRVILNVHYPSDVIGGYAFGFIWTAFGLFVYEGLRKRYPQLRP
ncbi:phosphatase PAP2 family protein [Bacillus sp. EB01]|uniref:phosphatase PAP2 family protein n=1 Tax=Bacillus sp. EB01 TaxID=1347086 RepID=UPI0005C707E6|nr:phosphatase PAP2 family protein [Bacillus sp. EB01]